MLVTSDTVKVNANGDTYTGDYKDGEKHGTGTLTLASGDTYTGEFKYGKRHSKGAYARSHLG